MTATEMRTEKVGGSGMTRVEAVKRALYDGLTKPADIQNYCGGLGVADVKRSYISCIKWGVKQERMAPVANLDKDCDYQRDAIEFVIHCGGIEGAIKKLDTLRNEPGLRLFSSAGGVDSAKMAVREIARRISS